MLNMMSPQLMQMLQQQYQGVPMGPTMGAAMPGIGPMGGGAAAGAPQAPPTPNPMALMQPQQHPMMGGMGPQGIPMGAGGQQMAPNTLQALGGIGGLSQLLQRMGGGQQGVQGGLLSGVIPGIGNMLGFGGGGAPVGSAGIYGALGGGA